MLVELNVVEQRYRAVLEVLNDGATVADVARRLGVAAADRARVVASVRGRRPGRVGRSQLEALVVPAPDGPGSRGADRGDAPGSSGVGAAHDLVLVGPGGVSPLPGRSSVERCLIRHGLVTPQARKRKRSDYKRWERSRAMELWQMDVVGGVRIVDGSEAKVVSGLDDHSRFVVSARVVARATARPVCDALTYAMRVHGVPEQILTDNGKVFTARFGPGPGPVLFDRICNDNGVRHILTAPRSPTTTGKVERWHKTLRREFLDGKVFASIADAQAQLDGWVWHYNHERPHQSIGRVPPIERFQLAEPRDKPAKPFDEAKSTVVASGPVTTRRVSSKGTIGFATVVYKAGAWLAGQTVEVVCEGGLVQIHHRGVLVATHARRHPIDKQTAASSGTASRGRHDRRCRRHR